MEKIISPFLSKFSDKIIDEKEVNRIGKALNLHPKIIELLFQKEITDEECIKNFLYPSKNNFHDPFLMKNMREVTARISEAVSNSEKIVIYGDYDCDGICASAMLSLYLSGLGAEVFCHIPNRECDGYGLNIESLERIIENCSPDIIITCDCGISCIDEIAHTIDLGVDIIVTDHHEAGEKVPECLILNPKQSDCFYPYNQLCGAGVVLKLIEAHGGIEKASEYFGLAAIATVADLVPLMDENRLIVKLGLEYGELIKNIGIKLLFEKIGVSGNILSSDIAYKIAPRINAAGRMGDAYRAFQLLTSSDINQIESIIEEIELDNEQRKDLCNRLYDEAIEIIGRENIITNHAIIISHPEWEKGITGIVAARISNEFCRPAFILVKSGDFYKGTARGILGINVYELLTSVKDILMEFGGHTQAAGFSISGENIPEFKRRVNEYLTNFDHVSFVAKAKFDVDIDIESVDMELMRGISLLEPFGNGNSRPLFRLSAKELKVSALKNSDHLCIAINDDINIYAFSYRKQAHLFMGLDKKELILDFKLNTFKNKTKIDAYVKACVPESYNIDDNLAMANFIKYINYKEKGNAEFEIYDENELDSLLDDNIFGTLIITCCNKSYEKLLKCKKIEYIILREVIYAAVKNNYNRVIASPEFDENLLLPNYDKIIFLDTPINNGIISFINKRTSAKVYIPRKSNMSEYLSGIDMTRETFARYYNQIKENEHEIADDLYGYYKMSAKKAQDFDLKQFIVCLSVFVDLDLVKISRKNFNIKTQKNIKANLIDSPNYVYIKERIDEIEA